MPVIHLKNNTVEYKFEFYSKYLIITGDSATGKSTLVELAASYVADSTAVDCFGAKNLAVLYANTDLSLDGQIFFLDESNPLLWSEKASRFFKESNNYFIIITRDRRISQFKLGLHCFATMKNSGAFHYLEFDYPKSDHLLSLASTIVCEDNKAGKQFLEHVLGCEVLSSGGNTRFGIALKKMRQKEYTIVYDRAGIGYEYADQLEFLKMHGITIVSEIDWDSFEAYILESEEYGVKVSDYPDKEMNAVRLFKEMIDKKYDKSFIPDDMQYPVYWKVKEAQQLVSKEKIPQDSKPLG